MLAKKFGTVEKFAEKCGLNVGSLRNAIHRGSEIKSSTIEAISRNVPNINLRWLLLGEGEMFVDLDRESGDLSGQELQEDKIEYITQLNDLLSKRVKELEREIKRDDPDKARELGID